MKRLAIGLAVVVGLLSALTGRGADFNGDGTNEIGIFRESNGLWAIRDLTRTYFGQSNDQPLPGDYNGDGTVDIGLFRPGSDLWAVKDLTRVYFGVSTDEALIGVVGRGASFWKQTGTDLYYTGGKVAIGTTALTGTLHVEGSISTRVRDVQTGGTHQVNSDDSVLLSSAAGGCTFTLPAAANAKGRVYYFYKTGTGGVMNLNASGSDNLYGTTFTTTDYACLRAICINATSWVATLQQ